MNFGELIHDLQTNAKKVIRKIERTERKLQKAKSALVFNETCINEDILPKYTNIKLHDPAAKEAIFTKEYRKKLVSQQIETKSKLVRQLELELTELYQEFEQCHIDTDRKERIRQTLREM